MADHVVCVSVRIKNHNNTLENFISNRIGRFNHKLTLEDIVCIKFYCNIRSIYKEGRWVFNLRVKKNYFSDRPIPEKQGHVRGNKNTFKVGLILIKFSINSVKSYIK